MATLTSRERTIEITLPRRHPAQQQVAGEARRFNVICCGRRWGKTTLGIDLLIRTGLAGCPAGWFSPTYKMLLPVWRSVRARLAPVTRHASNDEHRLELVTGGIIEMWSLDNPDTARGRAYARVVIDEAAAVPHLATAWEAVLQPTLIDYSGDAWFLSTPRGHNYFYTLWQRGMSGEPEWFSWRMPTATNPHIPAEEIARAERTLPARVFAQEYRAEFIADATGVFRRVVPAATAAAQERALPGHRYVMGVDWGKHEDFTVICVLDLGAPPGGPLPDRFAAARAVPPGAMPPSAAPVPTLVAIDRFNQIDYAVQAGRLRALAARFTPVAIVAERNAMGEPVIEQLLREGLPVIPFTVTNATKMVLIDRLALGFEQDQLRILPDPILIAELEAYTTERTPSGLLRYGAPPGMHDDCVMALALAYWGATGAAGAGTAPSLYP